MIALKMTKEHHNILTNIMTLFNSSKIPESFTEGLTIDRIKQSIFDNLATVMLAELMGKNLAVDTDYKYIKDLFKNTTTNDERKAVSLSEGLSVAFIAGYFQLMNIDIVDNPELSQVFGFNTLVKGIKKVLTTCGYPETEENVISRLNTGLSSELNSVDLHNYFEQGLYIDDINRLKDLLLSGVDDGYNVDLKKALANNGNIKTGLTKIMKDLRALYNIIFEDGFGVNPYVGVLLDDKSFITIKSDVNTVSTTASTIKEGAKIMSVFAKRVYDRFYSDVDFSDKRQFDYDTIMSSKKPVYFPYKILEYALGRESTLNITRDNYKLSQRGSGWGSYSEEYVFPNLTEILLRGYYYAFEKFLTNKGVVSDSFIANDFIAKHKQEGYDTFVEKHLGSALSYMNSFINKLASSMTCVCILTKYPYVANEITAIYLRVTSLTTSSSIKANDTFSNALFKNLISDNANEVIKKPFMLTDGRTNEDGVALSAGVLEVQYDINPKLSKAEPLFGYIIQKQNQKTGKASSWDKILLGESPTGKELYASNTSDIKMQDCFTHNIYAGSRAGKGVMTMNILASAIASGKPIFYIDRKPDMASMLYGIAGDSQFIANGGLINPDNDLNGYYNTETGSAMKWFREITVPYLEAHPEIAKLFGGSTSYEGVLGDYIYFRAWFFVMGIIYCRSKLDDSNGDIRGKYLNGNDGVVVVLDELTGAQTRLGPLLGGSSELFLTASKAGDVSTMLDELKKIDRQISLETVAMDTAKTEKARLTAQYKIEDLEQKKEKVKAFDSIYASTLFSKIKDAWDVLVNGKLAGFQGKEFNFSDVFVLGQELTARYVTAASAADRGTSISWAIVPVNKTPDANGNVGHHGAFNNGDIIRSVIEEMGNEDWFIGRNADGLNYANKITDPAVAQTTGINNGKASTGDGNWVYAKAHSCEAIVNPSGVAWEYVHFKPYLVLNNSCEGNPPLDGQGEFQYVRQCAERTNSSAGGFNLWDTVRLKHLTSAAKENYSENNKQYGCLESGVGFAGLIEETLKTTKEGKEALASGGSVEAYMVKVLSKSGDMANFVAQKMGFSCWQELIFDLSPNGLFGFTDMLNALYENGKYNDKERLPAFSAMGMLDDATTQSSDESYGGSDYASKYASLYDDDESIQGSSENTGVASNNTQVPTSKPVDDDYEDAYAEFEDDESVDDSVEFEDDDESVDDYEDAYAEFEDDVDDSQSFGVDDSSVPVQPSVGVVQGTQSSQVKAPTRFSDAEVRNTASLAVSMALSIAKQLTGRDLTSIKEALIDNAVSIIREMGY